MSKFLVRKKPRDKYELEVASPPSSPAHRAVGDYGSITSLLNNEEGKKTQPANSTESKPKSIEDPSTYFADKIRKIDFVLVYEEEKQSHENPGFSADDLEDPNNVNQTNNDTSQKKTKKRQKHRLWRQKFQTGIQAVGLQIETDLIADSKNNLHFLKLHAPWTIISRYAEELNLRAPLQANPNKTENWSEWILRKLRLPNPMHEDVPSIPDYYTCPFKTSKIDSYKQFIGSDDLSSFFSRAQRSRLVYEILCTTAFGREKKGEVGLSRLVDEGAYSSAYPLHDGCHELPPSDGDDENPVQLNDRQLLHKHWARWGKWYKYQPLGHVRQYFGERVAIYFAWLGFYTGWLLPAAIVGLIVFLYGIATVSNDVVAQETCSDMAKNISMCPLCATCKPWDLHQICSYTKLSYLFDHPGTVFYAVFMSFWAVTFLENWKRKSASLAHDWDCIGFQDEEERPRPDFAAKAPYLEKNPITGIKEPAFPRSIRLRRIAAGSGLILIMISLVIIFIFAVIIYRTLASIWLFSSPATRPMAQLFSSTSGAIINLIAIMVMGRFYEKLALRLTNWEMHRTQSEFDDNLTFKVFIFQFINFYSSILYIAFFKGKFVGYPGHYKHIFGKVRNEDCGNGGCLIELAQQLAVIMIGKQLINNAQEVFIPKLKAWWHTKKSNLENIGSSQMEQDFKLVENEGLFQEYLEMVLQFGFITIFVAAFPLAPFFALLNNWMEIRLDASKFVGETRRAVAERAENIGIWFKIMEMLAQIAVISNGFLIAFTSEFIQKLVYKYDYGEGHGSMKGYVMFTLSKSPKENWIDDGKAECYYKGQRDDDGKLTPVHWKIMALKLAFVLVFEHIVFGVCKLIDLMVPDIPASLDIKIKRERFLAKEALQDADDVLQRTITDEDRVDSDTETPPARTKATLRKQK